MKKIVCFLLAFSWAFVGGACDMLGNNSQTESTSENSEIEISYGEKYICGFDAQEAFAKQKYYIIQEDGTAEYHYYNSTYDILGWRDYAISAYTIYLKYQFGEENTIYCYYDGDGITYDDADTEKENNQSFFVTLTYDKDFLTEENGTVYVTQSYLDDHPNFG